MYSVISLHKQVELMNEKELFKIRQQLPLEAKVEMTKNRIREWYDFRDGSVYAARSGGKDSDVLGHILASMGGKYSRIPQVFSNTGLEMPEIVKHVREYLIGELGHPIKEIKPDVSYRDVWQKEGIPLVSKKVARQIRTLKAGPTGNGDTYRLYDEGVTSKGHAAPRWKLANKWRHLVDNPEIKTTEKCCDYLKKDPIKKYERMMKDRLGEDLKGGAITGMMADEGGYRAGMTKCNVMDGKTTRSSPMLFWTEADIWEYIEKYNVQICEVYYARMYNDEGDMVACDSKFVDLPSIKEFTKSKPLLNMTKWDNLGSFALYEDWDDNNRKYGMTGGEKRTGCMFCAFGAHLEKGSNRFQRMSISHPRQHKLIMDRIGMREPLELIDVKVTFDD
ncbi:hypothetical protein [Vibrio phage LP.1]|nr:hypothetical protein [Vibrio phage LP.1]